MSDNTQIPNSDLIASDDVAGVKFQRVKLALGGDGVHAGDVSAANPMPVQVGNFPAPVASLTNAELRAAAVSVLGTVALDAATLAALETITVANPTPQGLTDTQLRASALAVTVSNPTAQGLTDAQLRAAAVPVALASVAVSNLPATQAISGTVAISNFPAGGTGLTDAELRAVPLAVADANAVQDATVQALSTLTDTMLYMLGAILEKMPRVTGNDQAAVSIEAGSVGISGTPTVNVTTLGNVTSMGGKQVAQLPDAISQLGALHLYQNIIVS